MIAGAQALCRAFALAVASATALATHATAAALDHLGPASRVMRHRLKLAKSELSPEQAMAQLRRIQRHSVSINRAAPMTGVSTVNTEQAKVLAALNVKKPDNNAQMSLL
jgi:hypothetical protein